MWNYEYPEELEHYGVPGMKWGVRKRSYDAGISSISRRQMKKNATKAARSARLETINEMNNSSNKYTLHQYGKASRAAAKKAAKESIAKDKIANGRDMVANRMKKVLDKKDIKESGT